MRHLHIPGDLHPEPAIARGLWAFEDTRRRTLEELGQLEGWMVDWAPPGGLSSVAAVLYHMAVIEADWLYAEVLEAPTWPAEVMALFPIETRDERGELLPLPGESIAQHIERLAAVRAQLLGAYAALDLADFRRPRELERYHVTPEWVLHHLIQHEAEHRGQIGALRALAAAQGHAAR